MISHCTLRSEYTSSSPQTASVISSSTDNIFWMQRREVNPNININQESSPLKCFLEERLLIETTSNFLNLVLWLSFLSLLAVQMFQNERLRTEAQYLPPSEKYTKIGIFFE
jgi:hypothetical protein